MKILHRTPSIDSLSLNFEARDISIKLMKHSMRFPVIRTCIQGFLKFGPAFEAGEFVEEFREAEFDNNHKKIVPQNIGSLSTIEPMEPSKPCFETMK